MEVQEVFCRLCLNTISDQNFTVIDKTIIEVLNVLLLNLDLWNTSVMCQACFTKAFAAFHFKAICTNTEDCIFRYVNSENGPHIDLIEIYLEERDKEHLKNVLGDEKICRLCMQICAHGFIPVKDLETGLTCKYIPEVNFSSTKNSVICLSCFDALNTHTRFLKNCSDIRDNITNTYADKKRPLCIKTEEIEIKSEEDETGNTAGWDDEPCGSQARHKNLTGHHLPTHRDSPEMLKYQCDIYGYKTKIKINLECHQLIHEDISEVRMYKCDKCSYETKIKRRLKCHELLHKDDSEVQMYKCDTCSFTTRHKGNLNRHQLTHKDVSQVHMYKCAVCSFETKDKRCLKCHELRHKNSSEVQMYRCDTCTYKTKIKSHLKRHKLVHKSKSEVEMYKCDMCSYKTSYKGNLKAHQLRHEKISAVRMYKCDICNFQTELKINLECHLLTHKDIFEVEMYKCDTCGYETKNERYLKRHEQRHKSIGDISRGRIPKLPNRATPKLFALSCRDIETSVPD